MLLLLLNRANVLPLLNVLSLLLPGRRSATGRLFHRNEPDSMIDDRRKDDGNDDGVKCRNMDAHDGDYDDYDDDDDEAKEEEGKEAERISSPSI